MKTAKRISYFHQRFLDQFYNFEDLSLTLAAEVGPRHEFENSITVRLHRATSSVQLFVKLLSARHKLLVANRGEIAIRVLRAARELSIPTMAIYAYEDRFSDHYQC
jgi:hypothetical protein